jgi:hypothetical protein
MVASDIGPRVHEPAIDGSRVGPVNQEIGKHQDL